MIKFIYIICPVRNAENEQRVMMDRYVDDLEKEGYNVFYPPRDAPQESETGYEIVELEFKNILTADEIHVFWDVNSKGSHFDLGMCYALGKKIFVKYMFQHDSPGKSYMKVIERYSNERTNVRI